MGKTKTQPNWRIIEDRVGDLVRALHGEVGWFNEEELQNTPRRVAKFYREWIDNDEVNFTMFNAPMTEDQSLVVLKNITLHSLCSHHMLPFSGYASIAYYPRKGGKICGVSKLVRAVRKFASRPQTQEDLTHATADYIFEKLSPEFCMVYMSATHTCMTTRGVREHESKMVTSALRWNKKSDFANKYFEKMKEEALAIFLNKE